MTHALRNESPLFPAIEEMATTVVRSCFSVHSAMGPGMIETVYEHCLFHELTSRELRVAWQVALPVVYNGIEIEAGYRVDVLVENQHIIELK